MTSERKGNRQLQGVAVWEEVQLDVDPSAAWVVAGDLNRLDDWAQTTGTTWSGDLPTIGESFTTSLRVLGRWRSIDCEVVNWQAGRRFHLKLGGLPMSESVDIECRVESVVETGRTGTTLALGYAALVTKWVANPIRLGARRRILRALRDLGELAARG